MYPVTCPSIYLATKLPVYQPIDLCIYVYIYHLYIHPSIYLLSIYLSVKLSIYPSMCISTFCLCFLSIYPSTYVCIYVYASSHRSIDLCVCRPIYLSVCHSIYLPVASIYISVSMHLYLSINQSVDLSIYLYLPIYPSIYMLYV